MFVGYENFSTYFVDADDLAASDVGSELACFPNELKPHFQIADPWFAGSACSGDFVVVAEFSELEGPVPRLVIPDDGRFSDFSLDTFIVRLMSVDHQHIQGTNFNISEDAHVILTQSEHGLYAYVQHFTLYDTAARGFVRPFCLAYVTPDYSKLMNFYEELHAEFSAATRHFKAGNHLLFLRDMTHKLSDLLFTKEKLVEGKSEAESLQASESSLSVADLERAITDVQRIIRVIGDQIERPDSVCTQTQCHISCCWDQSTATPLDTNNFLFALYLQHDSPQSHAADDCSVDLPDQKSYKPQLVKTLKHSVPKKLGTLEELCQHGTSSGLCILKAFHKYFSRDSVTLLIEREDIHSLEPSCSLLTIGRLFYMNMLTPVQLPVVESQSPQQHQTCVVCSQSHLIPDARRVTHRPCHLAAVFQCLNLEHCAALTRSCAVTNKTAAICQSAASTDCRRRPEFLDVKLATSTNIPSRSSLVSVSDHVEHLTDTALGFGLLHFIWQFAASPHVLFSLLIGRPVIVLGSVYSEKQIRAIINALWAFVPGHSRHHCQVLPWCTAPLTVNDLRSVKLCGLAQPHKNTHDHVTSDTLRKIQGYVTVLNIDKKTLWSPKYTGSLLTEIISVKSRFTSDSTYISYIYCKLFDMAMKAFICYHRHPAQSYSSGDISERVCDVATLKSSAGDCSRLHLAEDDLLIVNYLVDVVRKQQTPHTSSHQSTADYTEDLRLLSQLQCYSFNL